MSKATLDHIVLEIREKSRKRGFLCRHCTAREPITLPVRLRQLTTDTEKFITRHRHCKPAPVSHCKLKTEH